MSKKPRSFSKKIDELAGIPLLFALTGLGSGRNNSLPEYVSRCGFLRMDSGRDTVFIESAAKAFKKRYPGSSLIFFAGGDNILTANLIGFFDEIIRIYPEDAKKSIKIVKESGKFDIWVDFGIWSRFEAILTFFADSKFKIGFKTEAAHRHFVYDRVAPLICSRHITDSIRDLMNCINVVPEECRYIGKKEISDKKLIVFNMFADNREQQNRQWDEENWKYILSRLTKRNYKIALTGDKSNTDEADKFAESVGADIDLDYLVGRLDPSGILDLLSKTALVISPDSWLLYVAATIGVPVLGLYGPTSSKMYSPVGKNAYHIMADISCGGCQNIYGDEKCHVGENLCMKSIDVHTVETLVFDILEGR